MRAPVDAARIQGFLARLGRSTRASTRVYLTGGATAVLEGWRSSTVDIDLIFDPDNDEVLRAVAGLRDEMGLNVELAWPGHFIPMPPGWSDRSPFVVQEGSVAVFHVDLYAQALAKLERGHDRDLLDVAAMRDRGLIEIDRLLELFDLIRPDLFRFPAVDQDAFAARVKRFVAGE